MFYNNKFRFIALGYKWKSIFELIYVTKYSEWTIPFLCNLHDQVAKCLKFLQGLHTHPDLKAEAVKAGKLVFNAVLNLINSCS